MADAPNILAVIQQIREKFPDYSTLIESNPEIAGLLFKHANDGNSVQFQQELHQTKWWKDTPPTAREWQVKSVVDPAWANRQRASTMFQVTQAAGTLGVPLSAPTMANVVDEALSQGLSGPELTHAIVSRAHAGTLTAGALTASRQTLRQTATDYGVPISDATIFNWARGIADGTRTTDGFTAYARTQATRQFPHLADEIAAGHTVREIADPYLQIAGNLLGRDPAQFDLMDSKWTRALQGVSKDGKLTGPMTNLDWQRTVMTDPTYGYDHSEHARNAAFQLRDQLAQAFGVKAAS